MTEIMRLLVVYKNTSDFPGKFVARWQRVMADGSVQPSARIFALADTLEEIREKIAPLGLVWLNRLPNDDPVIVETWL